MGSTRLLLRFLCFKDVVLLQLVRFGHLWNRTVICICENTLIYSMQAALDIRARNYLHFSPSCFNYHYCFGSGILSVLGDHAASQLFSYRWFSKHQSATSGTLYTSTRFAAHFRMSQAYEATGHAFASALSSLMQHSVACAGNLQLHIVQRLSKSRHVSQHSWHERVGALLMSHQ